MRLDYISHVLFVYIRTIHGVAGVPVRIAVCEVYTESFWGLVFLLGAGGSIDSETTIRFCWSFVVQRGFQISFWLLVGNGGMNPYSCL